jgi:flavin reductase (DIM6/NTAB) family NADH-FMN oxidoreductase RutF
MNTFRYTLKGIRENGTFSVNLSSCEIVRETDYCGIYSGKNRDKSQIFKTFYGELKTAPLIQECPLNLECKVIHSLDLGSHILIVGEVIETYVTEDCVTDGKADPAKIDPLIYITRTMKYHRLGEVVAQAFNVGKELLDDRLPEAVLADCLAGR